MDVILLERIPNLGLLGETVKVKDGYARNYLFPKNKALRATKSNKERFDSQRDQIEARSQEQRADAEHLAGDLNGQSFTLIRQAGESGQLYGSVTARDLADATNLEGFTVPRAQFVLNQPIKTTGLHEIAVQLHPEVQVTITVNVARSPEEAERQARGEDPTSDRDDSFEDSYENPEAVAIPGVNL